MKWTCIAFLVLITTGMLFPASADIPVQNASCSDWNSKTFWFEPWGSSGVHKGIDIFAGKKTPVIAATSGLVLFSGKIKKGGNIIVMLGPKWRIHYYAHLDTEKAKLGEWASSGSIIGDVGQSGNAKGKPPHLHYSVLSLIPYFWLITMESQGWKKAFYLNPADTFKRCR